MQNVKKIFNWAKNKKWLIAILILFTSILVSFSTARPYLSFDSKEMISNDNNYTTYLYQSIIENSNISNMKFENGRLLSDDGLFVKTISDESGKSLFEFRFNAENKNDSKILLERIYLAKAYNPQTDTGRVFSFAFFSSECYYFYIYSNDNYTNPENYLYKFYGEYNDNQAGTFRTVFCGSEDCDLNSFNKNLFNFMSQSYKKVRTPIIIGTLLSSFLIYTSVLFSISLVIFLLNKDVDYGVCVFLAFSASFLSSIGCLLLSFFITQKGLIFTIGLAAMVILYLVFFVILRRIYRNEKGV